MRNKKLSFSLAGTALALLITYVLLLIVFKPGAVSQQEPIWRLSVTDIMLIVINEHGEELRFENDKQLGWILSEPSGIPYDRSIAEALPLTLTNLTAEKEIATSAISLSQYGLDDPIEIQLFLKDGTMRKLFIGDISITGDSRYFSIDTGIVYTMDAAKGASLALNYLNIRDKNVLGLNRTLRPRDIAARITDIRVNGESSPEFADALARLTAEVFLGEGEFNKYGLETPRYTIEFMTENGAKTLYIGNSVANGEDFYARTSDNDYVFTISKRGFDKLVD